MTLSHLANTATLLQSLNRKSKYETGNTSHKLCFTGKPILNRHIFIMPLPNSLGAYMFSPCASVCLSEISGS